jgi:hypothetical protein
MEVAMQGYSSRLSAAAVLVLIFGLSGSICRGQSFAPKEKASAGAWVPRRTPDGQPDLQGVWTNVTATPLERPKTLGDKAFFTKEEAAAFEKAVLVDTDGDRLDGGADANLYRSYNEAFRDRGHVVGSMRTSLIIDPPNGRIPELTPEAKARLAAKDETEKLHPADGPEFRSPRERCLWWQTAGPPMIPANYNSNYQIVQGPGYLIILSEMIHDARVIPLDGGTHLPADVRLWMGDPRGHWEGNTLVVDSTNFTNKTGYAGSTDKLHLIERFTRTDPNTILYEFTMDDPSTFTKPWTVQVQMHTTQGPIFEYACHEGNYALTDILRGARADEKQAVGQKK